MSNFIVILSLSLLSNSIFYCLKNKINLALFFSIKAIRLVLVRVYQCSSCFFFLLLFERALKQFISTVFLFSLVAVVFSIFFSISGTVRDGHTLLNLSIHGEEQTIDSSYERPLNSIAYGSLSSRRSALLEQFVFFFFLSSCSSSKFTCVCMCVCLMFSKYAHCIRSSCRSTSLLLMLLHVCE